MSLTIPNNAPFTGAQRMWLKGFLDGVNTAFGSASTGAPTATLAPAPSGLPVTILWGSQTGSSEGLPKKLAKTLAAKGDSPVVKEMAEVSPADLTSLGHLLVITSTYGDGEPPDNAAPLHAALHADDAPALSSVNYSVLALGDSSYPDFCKCGHDFDQRLAALGANRIAPLVECDVDFDEPYAAWLKQLETALVAA